MKSMRCRGGEPARLMKPFRPKAADRVCGIIPPVNPAGSFGKGQSNLNIRVNWAVQRCTA